MCTEQMECANTQDEHPPKQRTGSFMPIRFDEKSDTEYEKEYWIDLLPDKIIIQKIMFQKPETNQNKNNAGQQGMFGLHVPHGLP